VNSARFITRFRNIDWLQPSVIAIIVANLVPLVALFVFHWDVFSLVFLFWLENVIIGIINVLKIALAGVGANDLPPLGGLVFGGLKLFMIPFFCMHFGTFTLVQGVFVISLFGPGGMHGLNRINFESLSQLIRDNHLEWPFAALVASHVIAFGWDYLWRGEFRHTNPMELMTQPYRRIMLMQFTVIVGGFLTMALHLPEAALIFLVVLKTVTDLWGHQNVRDKAAARETFSPATSTVAPTPSIQGALQAALQARAAQAGQAGRPLPLPGLAVILIFLVGALCFAGFVSYQFIRPFIGHPQPRLPPARRTVSWTLDLGNAQYPDTPAAGLFRGNAFHVEHAIFANGTLSLRQGGGTNSRTFVITISLREGETLPGHSYKFLTDAPSPPPGIKLEWHENNSKKTQTQTFANGYAMKLDFFWPKPAHGKIPAMIYLCVPDSDKSYLAGKFDVLVRKPKSGPQPADN
jgi:hypothetical protein